MSAPLNLATYGIRAVIDDAFEPSLLKKNMIKGGFHTINPDTHGVQYINLDNNLSMYTVLAKLGAGTYGTTYKVKKMGGGPELAIKVVRNLTDDSKVMYFLSECIIQLLLYNASKDEAQGPFVPALYEVAYDHIYKIGYIRSEILHNTLKNLTDVSTAEENDILYPNAISQIALILKFLGRPKIEFNHRDLKQDNIMYIKKPTGERIFKLIDFGFSCMKLPNGKRISGGSYFDTSPTCFKTDRDLSQFLYDIFTGGSKLTPELKERIGHILVANVSNPKKHTCSITKGCPADRMTKWMEVYRFLNRDNVTVPHGTPDSILTQMARYVAKEPFATGTKRVPRVPVAKAAAAAVVVEAKVCPLGKIVNPKTGRCVKEGGAVGKLLVKKKKSPAELPPCAAGKERSKETRRCVNVCPPGKVRNNATRKCRPKKANE